MVTIIAMKIGSKIAGFEKFISVSKNPNNKNTIEFAMKEKYSQKLSIYFSTFGVNLYRP